jgi:hypothetical protein
LRIFCLLQVYKELKKLPVFFSSFCFDLKRVLLVLLGWID